MNYFFKIVILVAVIGCYSCKKDQISITNKERLKKLELIKTASEEQKQNPDLDSRLAYWNKQLQNPDYGSDSVLLSKIHYNLAGVFYGKDKLDSIKSHMQWAWALMENQNGFDAEKVLLYSGLGNIASMEQKVHQENYYFSRAAQMLMADSTIDLLPKSKTSIYFAAGQASAKLRQFPSAFKYNRKAIALFKQLPNDVATKFRGYSQMAVCFYSSNGSLDSLYSYIQKMQALYHINPDVVKERFIADRKAVYFERTAQLDSLLFYNRKRVAMDVADTVKNGASATSVKTGNLFLSYADMAALFINQKKTDSGLYYLNKCEEFAKKYPNKIDDEGVMLYRSNMVNYLFASKQYARAEKQQEVLLQDFRRLYETENARSIAEMGTIIQLQVKDKSINNLNASVALAEEKLQSNRLWLAVSALTALLAMVLVMLLYYIQIQRKLRNENEKTQLEQRLLRTQMEPHFIFNTLSALQSFVRFDEKEKTLKYLNQFGRLLRSSLELSRESAVPLNDEIETLENYLSLQQMRFDNAFTYEINLHDEDELEGIYIPPMLMQPFVENALLHGINPDAKNGHIFIDFIINDNLLGVMIADNGKGITINPETPQHKSLSTTISKERLAILAKETGLPAGISIDSKPNLGTIIKITIPIKTAKGFSDNKLKLNE